MLQAAQESKQNVFIFKNYIKTRPKRCKLRQGFFKYKKKHLVVSKKFGNGPEQKLLDRNFLVLIENVLFRSRILFQKRIYSIFFGTKAPKRKLSILKERWFDIATAVRCTKSLRVIFLYRRSPFWSGLALKSGIYL